MTTGFQWDPTKRESNLEKHGIDFVRAVRIFEGRVLQRQDTRRDYRELRIVATGEVDDVILTVVYTLRGESIRIISARRASRHEARAYREVRPEEA